MPSPYYGYLRQANDDLVSLEIDKYNYHRNKTTGYTLVDANAPTFPSSWSDSAYQRALLKLKHRHVNLAVDVGEIKETIRMLDDSVRRVIRFYQILRGRYHISERDWYKLLDAVPSLWLEYRYGWLPFLSEVFGAIDSIDARMKGEYDKPSLTTRARNVVDQSWTENLGTKALLIGTRNVNVPLYRDWKVAYTCRVRMDVRVLDSTYRSLADTGITDPLLVAWELLPYSFVVDWFLGIGRYLDGLNAMWGLRWRGGSVTKRYTLTATQRWDWGKASVPLQVTGEMQSLASFTRFDRSVISTPASKLVWYGFENFDLTHALDAITLLHQRLRGGSRYS